MLQHQATNLYFRVSIYLQARMKYPEDIITNEDLMLLENCLKHQQEAFHRIYSKYSKRFMAIAFRYTNNKTTAEDVIQEAFIKIFNSLNTFSFKGSFEGWMKRIVIRTALNEKRNLNIRFKEETVEVLPERENQLFVQPDLQLQLQDLHDMLNQLPEGYKIVFQLFAIEGFQHKEIAELLNINEGTSKSQLSKARNMLKEMLNKTYTNEYGK